MCGRVIQSSGPLRYAIVDGMNVRDSRVHNYPPRWNAAPSQELLVIRRNHKTGEVSLDPLRWGLIPLLVQGPRGRAQADQRQVRDGARPADLPGRLPQAPLHRAGGRLLRVEGDQGPEGKAALRHRHEGRRALRHRRHLGELEGARRPVNGSGRSRSSPPTPTSWWPTSTIACRSILAPDDYARWLSDEPDPRDLMRPFPADLMRMWPISTRVNKPENDDPSIVEPVEPAIGA